MNVLTHKLFSLRKSGQGPQKRWGGREDGQSPQARDDHRGDSAIDKMVRSPSRVVVFAKGGNPPKRLVYTAESPSNKMADTAIARRSPPPRIRGLALGCENGMNCPTENPARGEI